MLGHGWGGEGGRGLGARPRMCTLCREIGALGKGNQMGPCSRPGEKMVLSGVGRNSQMRVASQVAHSGTGDELQFWDQRVGSVTEVGSGKRPGSTA